VSRGGEVQKRRQSKNIVGVDGTSFWEGIYIFRINTVMANNITLIVKRLSFRPEYTRAISATALIA
jgi:thymidine kinase